MSGEVDKAKTTIIVQEELSKWECYMFGNKPGGSGLAYRPTIGNVPNIFIRYMMKICFACTWVKEK